MMRIDLINVGNEKYMVSSFWPFMYIFDFVV